MTSWSCIQCSFSKQPDRGKHAHWKNHFRSASWEVIILLTGKSIKDGVCNTPLHRPETANPPILMSRKPPETSGYCCYHNNSSPLELRTHGNVSPSPGSERAEWSLRHLLQLFVFNKDKCGPAWALVSSSVQLR